MSDGLLPPFGIPLGEPADDARVMEVFVGAEPVLVHSPTYHLEGATLVAGGDIAVSLRLTPRAFLVRLDIPPAIEPARDAVQAALEAAGMSCVDSDTLLAAPIAIQVLGLRSSSWDLWGANIDEAFFELRAAAAGEWDGLFPEGPPAVPGPGPTG